MIYDQIEAMVMDAITPRISRLRELENEREKYREELKTTDSKKREAELKDLIKGLNHLEHQIWGEQSGIREDAFRELLKDEYGVRDNPKFDKAYSIAYQRGHSAGFGDVESCFADIVELIK